jgi:hypothetical protein
MTDGMDAKSKGRMSKLFRRGKTRKCDKELHPEKSDAVAAAPEETWKHETSSIDIAQYGYEDARPDPVGVSKSGYRDTASDDDDDEEEDDNTPPPSSHRQKTKNRRRRASIQFGETASEHGGTTSQNKARAKLSEATDAPMIPRRRPSFNRSKSVDALVGEDDDDDSDDHDESNRRSSSMKKTGMPRRGSIRCTGEIEVYLPGKTKPVRRRTSISFAAEEEVKEVTPSKELTDHPEELWFQKEEIDQIRRRLRLLVDQVKHNPQSTTTTTTTGETDTRKLCTRGLESYIGEKPNERLKKQQRSVNSVLEIQDLQRSTGFYDGDYMSLLYQHVSKDSVAEATRIAKEDAEVIEKYKKSRRVTPTTPRVGGRLRRGSM